MLELSYPMIHVLIACLSLVAAWYLGIIQPQQASALNNQNIYSSLRVGSLITTSTGISGIVITHQEKMVAIQQQDGSLLEVLPWSITTVTNANHKN